MRETGLGVSIPEADIFTARKRSLGQGNIFAPVCHSVHRGRGVPGQVPPGQVHTPTMHAGIRSTSGRYASYWNAFLFHFKFSVSFNKMRKGHTINMHFHTELLESYHKLTFVNYLSITLLQILLSGPDSSWCSLLQDTSTLRLPGPAKGG